MSRLSKKIQDTSSKRGKEGERAVQVKGHHSGHVHGLKGILKAWADGSLRW